MKKSIVVLGAGGHARVVATSAIAAGYKVTNFYSNIKKEVGTAIFNIPVLDQDSIIPNNNTNAIIGIGDNRIRKKICTDLKLKWITIVHPFSWICESVTIGDGTIICAGSIVQPGAKIGSHVIVNTKSSVDHDTTVDNYAHISVAHLAGGATMDEGAMLALNSVVLPNLHVGAWAIVGAGATVTKDVEPFTTVVGTPAKKIK